MKFVSAIVAVIVIGWAAAHPVGDQFTTSPAPPSDCQITTHSNGPVDPKLVEMNQQIAEAICHGPSK